MCNWYSNIDWSATGSMLSAWAAIGGFILLYLAARNALKTYQRQKQEDRRIEIAERVLAVAYRFRTELIAVRYQVHRSAEMARASIEVRESGLPVDKMEQEHRDALAVSRIIHNRIEDRKAAWNALNDLMPSANAIFGGDVHLQLTKLSQLLQSVNMAASAYPNSTGSNVEFNWKLFVWQPEDDITRLVGEAIQALEKDLLPVIRADHP